MQGQWLRLAEEAVQAVILTGGHTVDTNPKWVLTVLGLAKASALQQPLGVLALLQRTKTVRMWRQWPFLTEL